MDSKTKRGRLPVRQVLGTFLRLRFAYLNKPGHFCVSWEILQSCGTSKDWLAWEHSGHHHDWPDVSLAITSNHLERTHRIQTFSSMSHTNTLELLLHLHHTSQTHYQKAVLTSVFEDDDPVEGEGRRRVIIRIEDDEDVPCTGIDLIDYPTSFLENDILDAIDLSESSKPSNPLVLQKVMHHRVIVFQLSLQVGINASQSSFQVVIRLLLFLL